MIHFVFCFSLACFSCKFRTGIRKRCAKRRSFTSLEYLTRRRFSSSDRHTKFLSECPHGYMTRKQFIAMYKSLCPKGDAERFARHVFRAFDVDKSNTVDFREFLLGLSMTASTNSPEDKLQWTFHVFDIDGNGLLTRRECLEVIESIVRFNQSMQGDHQPTTMEPLIISAKKAMMRIFDHVDETRRDKLTMSQFVQGCLKDEFISNLLAPTTAAPSSTQDTALPSPSLL